MRRRKTAWFLVLSMVGIAIQGSSAVPAPPPVDLCAVRPASKKNVICEQTRKVSVGSIIFEGSFHHTSSYADGFIIWQVPNGYRSFEVSCGINDTWPKDASGTIEFVADGNLVRSVELSIGRRPLKVSFPVTGGQSLRINMHKYGVLAEPRFLSSTSDSPGAGQSSVTASVTPVNTAPFVIEPRDLDNLASCLRKDMIADPNLQTLLTQSQIAIMTFDLIDISSSSVARNVAEDLYTSMIKAGFRLVERGQLDKALQELKIQNTGLIDPATAQKVGRISGCDLILLGSISDRGQFVVVNARLIETSTGKSVVAERVEMRKSIISR